MPKTIQLMTSLTKIQNPTSKQFVFHCRLEESFEGLNSSLPQSAKELCHYWDMCKLLQLGWNHTGC